MSNALMSETESVAVGPLGYGSEPGRAAGSARQSRGRISANSFRLLTAKLKGIPVDETRQAAELVSVTEEDDLNVAPPVPPATAGSGPEQSAIVKDAVAAAIVQAEVPDAVGQVALERDQWLNREDEAVAADGISPDPRIPAQGAEAGDETGSDLQHGRHTEDDLLVEQNHGIGFADVPPQAVEIALPEFSPAAWADPGDAASTASAGSAASESEPQESFPEVEAGTVRDEPAPAEDIEDGLEQAISPEADQAFAASEPPEEPSPMPSAADEQSQSDVAPSPDPDQAVAPDQTPELARSTVGATDDAPSAQTQSEMAGRVVDAMMKTISTAIYSKPSAAERVAFLREMAEQMEREEGGAVEPATPEVPTTAPLADVESPDHGDLPGDHEPGVEVDVERRAEFGDVLAGRLGPSSTLLKPKQDARDPFAEPPKLALLEDPVLTETPEADDETGELALTLLDMMSGGSGSALPQERTLAADTLLRILPRIPVKQLLTVVERVAIMETPPGLLVAKLIRDPRPEVVGPLLERCSNISDQDLINASPTGDVTKLRMMARRRVLSQVLSDYLISTGEPNVLLTLIRNPGAALSHDAFYRLAEQAANHHALLAPLTTRADLPPPVAFELFWNVPPELRRFIFSRFLTDSEALNKILRITMATHGGDGGQGQGEPKFASKDIVDAAIATAAAFRLEEAAQQLSEVSSISSETALRVLSDREGEPVAVLLKAIGYPRTRFEEVLATLRQPDVALIRPDRKPDELQAVFDSLSFNKARILLTYWDWFVRKAGPYAPHN